MNLKITKNKNEANIITHDNKFHPDDVFSTVFMSKYLKEAILYRSPVGPVNDTNAIIYDVGYGEFDHHTDDAKLRPNSKLKYCSFGLLWTKFGHEYLYQNNYEYIDELYLAIEEKLIKQIDGIDNGVFPSITAEYELLDLDKIIDMFNPTWNSNDDYDECFQKAVNFAEIIFDNVIKIEYSKIQATKKVLNKIPTVKNNILILDEYLPYQDAIFSSDHPLAKEIKVIILPSNRGGYCIKPRTINKDTKELLVNFPLSYRGKHDEELSELSGIKTAHFVHASGFLGSTITLEDAIKLAEKALENKE